MINVFCNDFGRMFNYLEYKHHMKINLVEDERSYVNQFSIYDSKGEEITDLFESYNLDLFQNSRKKNTLLLAFYFKPWF